MNHDEFLDLIRRQEQDELAERWQQKLQQLSEGGMTTGEYFSSSV